MCTDADHIATGVENSMPGRHMHSFFSIPVVHIICETISKNPQNILLCTVLRTVCERGGYKHF
jgi:hypothetical protein